jgi:ribosomal protein L14
MGIIIRRQRTYLNEDDTKLLFNNSAMVMIKVAKPAAVVNLSSKVAVPTL